MLARCPLDGRLRRSWSLEVELVVMLGLQVLIFAAGAWIGAEWQSHRAATCKSQSEAFARIELELKEPKK